MFVRRTTYNAMKRRMQNDITAISSALDTANRELAAAQAAIDDSNEELAQKLAAARAALSDILENKTKRPNATVQRIMSLAERGLDSSS